MKKDFTRWLLQIKKYTKQNDCMSQNIICVVKLAICNMFRYSYMNTQHTWTNMLENWHMVCNSPSLKACSKWKMWLYIWK